jgi:PAS domain S-box-containing protein
MMPLVSALRAAIKARRRQYQLRDQMDILAQTQEALQASQLTLGFLMEKLPAGAYTCDPDACITSFNDITPARTCERVAELLAGERLAVHRHVTERKRAERAMQESHALLRAVIESIPQAVYVKDLQGRYLMMNSPGARFIGKEAPEVLGRDDAALFEPETAQRIKEMDRQVLESGRSDTQEQTLTAAGVTRTYLTSKAPFRGAHGEVLGVLGISKDITEGKVVEKALRQSEERLSLAIQVADLGIFEHDHQTDAIYWSPMMRAILGWGAEEPASLQGFFELIHPEDRERIVSSVRQAHAPTGDGMYGVEHRVVQPDGGMRWVSVCSRTYFEGEFGGRRPLRTVGVVADITERKRAKEELQRQKERIRGQLAELENIYDYAPVGLCFVDRNLRFVHINEQLAAMNGMPAREHIGRTIREIIPDVADQIEQHFRRALDSGKPVLNVELHGVTAAEPGVARDWLANYVPLRSEAGLVIGVTVAVVEITSRKRAEQELREYSERVHALSRRLIAVQEEERRHLARELHDELGQVLATINFQLHAAKGLAGASALPRLEECGKLVQQAGEQVRSLALELRPTMLDVLGLEATLRWLCQRHQQRTGCGVQFHCGLNGAPLSADLAIACFRVAQEALTNVVRHAGAQHVWIELSQSDGVLEVVVRDDGLGFDVVREQPPRRHLGLLGMTERVQLLGGALQVESERGRGARIRASFPLRQVSQEPADPEE